MEGRVQSKIRFLFANIHLMKMMKYMGTILKQRIKEKFLKLIKENASITIKGILKQQVMFTRGGKIEKRL